MIYITGDMHGSYDVRKFNTKNFPLQRELTHSDYVIICGDFGLLWDGSAEEKYWLNWLESKPWTTLWIDGNHENFDMLKAYPVENWNGGQIQKITEHIFHLCRGNVFDIDGKRIFAFGGAESHDKKYRKIGKSMWEEELPTQEEIEQARQALNLVDRKVDVIITHSLPGKIQQEFFFNASYPQNILTDFFNEMEEKIDFSLWFSGHYHCSESCDEKHILLYNDIVKLTDNGFETVVKTR